MVDFNTYIIISLLGHPISWALLNPSVSPFKISANGLVVESSNPAVRLYRYNTFTGEVCWHFYEIVPNPLRPFRHCTKSKLRDLTQLCLFYHLTREWKYPLLKRLMDTIWIVQLNYAFRVIFIKVKGWWKLKYIIGSTNIFFHKTWRC